MCSINGVTGIDNAAILSVEAASAMQGRGSQSSGTGYWDGTIVNTITAKGLVRNLRKKVNGKKTEGRQAIGHTRYGTAGSNTLKNAQPFVSEDGKIALVHNGEIVGSKKFRQELLAQDVEFKSDSDSEVLLRMIEHSNGLSRIERLMSVLERVEGAYSLVILWEGDLIGVSDKLAMHPLCLGAFRNGGHIFASEDTAIRSVGARPIEHLKPGQIIVVTSTQDEVTYWIGGQDSNGHQVAHCPFNLVYTAAPTSSPWGISVTEARRALGSQCFEEMRQLEILPKLDVIVPMLDSGRTATLEFAKCFGHRRMLHLLEKAGPEALRTVDHQFLFPYACGINRAQDSDRNFQIATQANRESAISLKHFGDPAVIKNKRVLVGDDSLVRGTTAKNVVTMLKRLGALEVHFVIFSPPVTNSCHWGGTETKDENLLSAASSTVDEIRDDIGADSLHFITLESFKHVLSGLGSGFCLACWGGKQPIKVGQQE